MMPYKIFHVILPGTETCSANLLDIYLRPTSYARKPGGCTIMLATPHTSANVQQSLRIVFHAMKHHLYNTVKLTCSIKNLNSVLIMTSFLRCRSMYCPIWFRITRQGWGGRRGSQPDQDPHTFEIQINAEITTNISRLAVREQRRQNRGRTTAVVYTMWLKYPQQYT